MCLALKKSDFVDGVDRAVRPPFWNLLQNQIFNCLFNKNKKKEIPMPDEAKVTIFVTSGAGNTATMGDTVLYGQYCCGHGQ
jgi:hypothetical protein